MAGFPSWAYFSAEISEGWDSPLCSVITLYQPARFLAETCSSPIHFLNQLLKSLHDLKCLMGTFLVSILWCYGLAGWGGKCSWFSFLPVPYNMPHFKRKWAPSSLQHSPQSIIQSTKGCCGANMVQWLGWRETPSQWGHHHPTTKSMSHPKRVEPLYEIFP